MVVMRECLVATTIVHCSSAAVRNGRVRDRSKNLQDRSRSTMRGKARSRGAPRAASWCAVQTQEKQRCLAPGDSAAAPRSATALALVAPLAAAQAFPNKPVRVMVGYAAGGGVDAMARMLAQRLSPVLGQQVVVENRAGASGMIAAEAVARSAPDGYTLLMGESGMLITSHLQPRANMDPLKAFTPVSGTFIAPLMVVANNSVPAPDPRQLIALLKASPGKYSYATSGVGTVHHLGFEMLKAQTGAFIVHIPLPRRRADPAGRDQRAGADRGGERGGRAGAGARGQGAAIGLMNMGKLAGAENVAAIADALPGFNVAPRLMLLAPAGTPAAIVER